MRKLILTSIILCLASMAHAFPGSTNTASVTFSNAPTANFGDWSWKIYSTDDSTFVVTIGDSTPTTDFIWQFAIKGPTGVVQTISNTNITAGAGATVSFQLFRTNMVEAGTYYTELRAFTSGTNVSAVAGQGRLTVLKSLF